MNKKTICILHLLLAALVALTGVLPVTPALAAIPTEDTVPRTSPTPPQSPPILGGKEDRGGGFPIRANLRVMSCLPGPHGDEVAVLRSFRPMNRAQEPRLECIG